MNQELLDKYEKLKEDFRSMGSVAIAFSGGVDSTFLMKTAHEVLGDKAAAITVLSDSFPERERSEAVQFCEQEGVRQIIIRVDQMQVPGFSSNPANRCYLCKKAIFTAIQKAAEENGLAYVAEGSNMDDTGDYRPGMQAVKELGVKSPLQKAGMWKAEIRELSQMLGLPTWSKPSFACLATRIAYGEQITPEKLRMIEKAEGFLFDLGLKQARVRMHGKIARIEVPGEDIARLAVPEVRQKLVREFTACGFSYVTLDLTGYRTGSMNESLNN